MRCLHLVALAALALVPLRASAAFVLSHEGYVLGADDRPLAGPVAATFRLWKGSSTTQAGDRLWEDAFTLDVSDGRYVVHFGDTSVAGHEGKAIDVNWFKGDVFLGVELDGGGELSPRIRLAGVGTSARAAVADDLACVGCVQADEIEGVHAASIEAGTAAISITGNAATVTNGVYTTGSYSNPAWVTGLSGTKLTDGSVALEKLAGFDPVTKQVARLDTATLGGLTAEKYALKTDLANVSGVAVGAIGSPPFPCSGGQNKGRMLLDDATGSFWACTGAKFVRFVAASAGNGVTRDTSGLTCSAIKASNAFATDGIYWIDPNGGDGSDAFQAYCDMTTDGAGWTLVYKASRGVNADPVAPWSGAPVNEGDATQLGLTASTALYSNRLIQTYWNTNGLEHTEAYVKFVVNGAVQKFAKFDARGSNRTDWFDKSRVVASSWSDLSRSVATNFATLAGDTSLGRSFFLNRNYGSCPADAGWMVLDAPGDTCAWETNAGAVLRPLYSTQAGAATWQTAGQYAVADALVVFVRTVSAVTSDGLTQATANTSCQAIRTATPSAADGTFWIDPNGGDHGDAFRTWCDLQTTEGGGWTMVFKTNTNAADPATAWNGAVLNETDGLALNAYGNGPAYLNRIATTYWNTTGFPITHVRVHVLANGVVQKFMKFTPSGTSRTAWYSSTNVVGSSWTDVTTVAANYNYFSIDGDAANGRRFFVSKSYGGCPADLGWFVADTGTGCAWESSRTGPVRLLYANSTTVQNWTSGSVGVADAMMVLVR